MKDIKVTSLATYACRIRKISRELYPSEKDFLERYGDYVMAKTMPTTTINELDNLLFQVRKAHKIAIYDKTSWRRSPLL